MHEIHTAFAEHTVEVIESCSVTLSALPSLSSMMNEPEVTSTTSLNRSLGSLFD